MTHSVSQQILRLERYTAKRPQEVLLILALVAGEQDQIAIFRGFSSSLMRPTAFDPDHPILPENAEIIQIDLLQAPYDPANPRYLQQGLTWETIQSLLSEVGV